MEIMTINVSAHSFEIILNNEKINEKINYD